METRERFLDAVRALAVVRVMVWHAFGFAAITYFVSAVPAMFFVTGSLLARYTYDALDRRILENSGTAREWLSRPAARVRNRIASRPNRAAGKRSVPGVRGSTRRNPARALRQ